MDLMTAVKDRPYLLFDGGMGTELLKRGLSPNGSVLLRHPETVLAVHRQYVDAGCDVLITNTLTMNSIYLTHSKEDVDPEVVNRKGAELARIAAREDRFVVGDMSSTGQLLEPYGPVTPDAAFASFAQQAQALASGGVDGFLIETMYDMHEAAIAVNACQHVAPRRPVFVSFAFVSGDNDGRTMMGQTATDVVSAMVAAGATAVGVNCGDIGLEEAAVLIAKMRETAADLPLIAQANAGRPQSDGEKICYNLGPTPFAQGAMTCYNNGAKLLGGCCGTGRAHIQELATMLKKEVG